MNKNINPYYCILKPPRHGQASPALLLLFVLCLVSIGTAGPRPQPPAPNEPPRQDAPQEDTPRKPVSAQEVLDAMFRSSSAGHLIRPTHLRATPNLRAPIPEGAVVVDRAGRLMRREKDFFFVFEGDASARPIRLLPNRMLEGMVRLVEENQRDVLFVVSGQVTEFFGENYLLISFAAQRADARDLSK